MTDSREPALATPSECHTGAPVHGPQGKLSVLAVGALGIVFGDIGTSPLYALKESFVGHHPLAVDPAHIYGVLSLIFWTMMLIVTVKYVFIILRADNDGEGGSLALLALIGGRIGESRWKPAIAILGVLATALFYGDAMITPAISVLSAVEGLAVAEQGLADLVTPLAIGILVALFVIQRHGTARVGALFGPVMIAYFVVLAALGIVNIIAHPGILRIVNPWWAFHFFALDARLAFLALGSVVLSVTGAEALYADMGHFGKRPIRIGWLGFVLPSLILNYLGQGALVLSNPDALENPFFLLGPDWLRLPLVVLATLATIIASQAMISGAFSIARQCVQLGLLPRLTVKHTSETEEGQIYVPQVNFSLLAGVVVLVVTFRNSDSLAAAYGIAVTGTFVATSCLAAIVFHRRFQWSWWLVTLVFLPLLLLDLAFFISNVLKIPDGGWVPLLLGAVLYTQMLTWRRGRDLLFRRFQQDSLPLKSFLARLPQSRTIRVPGIAIFMTGQADYVPNALLHNLKHNKVLHERIVFVTVLNEDVPQVRDRGSAEELGPGIYRVLLRYGFLESPNIPRDLEMMHETMGVPFEPMQASYFLGRETVVAASVPKMPGWQQWLFTLMSRNSLPATEFFRIPSDRVVELGARVAI